jgi:uncharacterized membrane protein (UPF0127 family)
LKQLYAEPRFSTSLVARLMKCVLLLTSLLMFSNAFAKEATVIINHHRFQVELAVTIEQHQKGLQRRESLAPDQGMLFVFPEPRPASFWMKDTLIPLDILFFDVDGKVVQIFHNAQPCEFSPCKIYASGEPVRHVLELPAGSAKKASIMLGNKIEILRH